MKTTKFATAQKGHAKLLVTHRQCKAFNASPSPFVPSPLMVPFNINLHLAGALAAAASALAGFNPESGQNVAIYWGQNAAANSPESHNSHQERLAYYCDERSIDVINIAFITGITPVTVDLADADRSKIEEDIKICQKKGKTILISMGGGLPASTNWNSTFGAEKSAQRIWDMFGPVPLDNIDRPFGSAVVDGFDFDFESPINNLPAFARKLRHLMDTVTDRKFLLSAAPQCVNPDVNLATTLDAIPFDMVQIQFYNNPCGIDKAQEGAPSQPHFNFAVWDKWAQKSRNPKVKVLMGIPASNAAGRGYTEGSKLKAAIDWAKKYPSFGGVMMWDMAQLYTNKKLLQEVVENLSGGKQSPMYQVTSSVSIDSAKALSSSYPLYVGRWQPLRGQMVMDLAVVYGKEVTNLFNSQMWNPEVRDVDVIWPKSTYTVPYLTPLPTAALSASISWSSTSTDSLTTTMFLKFPASFDVKSRVKSSAEFSVDFTIKFTIKFGLEFHIYFGLQFNLYV
ncbi:class III chitinase [Cordyceps javanica]|uniref:chitinase n=1 Tax=Cordyceps javanica TaxID=43265 RepID=A0A545UKC8_9HYPO|nr:class III chitinase [Cordyceps javanica]